MLAGAGLGMSKKVLIVTGDGGDGYEALYAYHRFQEALWEPVVAAPSRKPLHLVFFDADPGWETYVERPGPRLDADVVIAAVVAHEFAALLFPGGRAPEYLRNDPDVLELVRDFAAQDKCICAIGHGIQVLAAVGLTKGRTVTCHPNVRIEVERSGGAFSSQLAVRDGKLVTAQSWRAHPEFYREIFIALR
jgi:protease I